jgi:hypothetical protein
MGLISSSQATSKGLGILELAALHALEGAAVSVTLGAVSVTLGERFVTLGERFQCDVCLRFQCDVSSAASSFSVT